MGDITSRGSLTFSYFHAFTFLIAGHVVSTDLRQRLMRPYLLNESHSICLLILRSHPLQMFQKYIFVVWSSTVAKKNEYNNDEEDSLITWNVINCFCFLLMRVSRYYYRCILCIKRLVSANLFELDFNSVTIFEVEVVGGLVVKNSVTVEKQSDRSNVSTNSVGVGTLELVKFGGPLNLEENLLVVGVGDLDVKSVGVSSGFFCLGLLLGRVGSAFRHDFR